jgi:competence protein ComEC
MPIVSYALAAYLAGLFAGFAGSLLICAFVIGMCAVAGHMRGARLSIPFAAIAIAGVVAARDATQRDARCIAATNGATSITVVVDDSVAPGAFVRSHLTNCSQFASLSVERGVAPAGATVRANGDVSRTARGIQVQHASVTVLATAALLPRWRAAAGRAIERIFQGDAPLVKALLIADRADLAPEVRDRFASAGLAHVLAIAGLHVAIIATAIALALELAGVPKRRAAIATIVTLIFYVALIGAPIPAVRSAVMAGTVLATRLGQRPVSRWAIVTVGAAQPLFDPRVVLDAGYQLSVVGVLAMISAGRLGKRVGLDRLPRVQHIIVAGLLSTTIATIASAPVVAWVFGRVAIIGPLTNLAANPLLELAQPMILFALVLAPITPIARLVADAAHPLLAGLDRVAAVGAAVPYGALPVAPNALTMFVACIMSACVIVACASRDWHRPAFAAVIAGVALVWLPVVPPATGDVELHMMDVGQGDAIGLRTAHGHWILFDAGRAWRGGDAGRSTIVPYIGRHGGQLDAFVLSHPHTDHVGGAATVLRALHPSVYVDAGFAGGADAYRASLDAARSTGVRWLRAHPGDSLRIDGVTISFLAPDSAWTSSLSDPNLASVVALVRVGDVRMLLVGDAERPEENWLLARDSLVLRADILKVGHHGSGTSSSDRFLAAVQPRLALVSVGAGNSYHLPTPAIMRALAAHGAQVLRTDRVGGIVVRTDGHRIHVEAAGDTWELLRSSSAPSPPSRDR